MIECFKCGIEKEDYLVVKAITPKGIKNICKDCLSEENYPIIKNYNVDNSSKVAERESKESIYKRLSGVNRIPGEYSFRKSLEMQRQNKLLRDLAESNLSMQEKVTNPEGLIEHFDWAIMRARKMNKMTREQLAAKIGETELAIRLAEMGILPKGYYNFILKLENALDITLMKDDFREKYKNPKKGFLNFRSQEVSSMKIKDIKDMTNQLKEKEINEKLKKDKKSDFSEVKKIDDKKIDSKKKTEEDSDILSDEELDKILSGD